MFSIQANIAVIECTFTTDPGRIVFTNLQRSLPDFNDSTKSAGKSSSHTLSTQI
eukprot:TRINITY_DN22709_c0_g1_i1.p2 TRINITY_DN22709_c0_g1~~TRINITY_DN22709_c0_g1_i1.p2  ORF type:complete len:54 (+),score=0.52 TRINITY_DN22709_c0_g1_i1:82-243(+)